MGLRLAAALAKTITPGLDLDEVPGAGRGDSRQPHEPGVR